MTLQLAFVILDFALIAGAVLLLVSVILRQGRGGRYLPLAALLIGLAIALWYIAIRTPFTLS